MAEQQPIPFHLSFLGPPGSGCRSLAYRLCYNKQMTRYPHMQVDFYLKDITVNDRKVRLRYWNPIPRIYDDPKLLQTYREVRGSYACFALFDVSSKASFDAIPEFLEIIRSLSLPNVVITLVANKVDLENRVISTEEAQQFATDQGLLYAEVSGKTGIGVPEMVDITIKEVIQRIDSGELDLTSKTVSLMDGPKMTGHGPWAMPCEC